MGLIVAHAAGIGNQVDLMLDGIGMEDGKRESNCIRP
jgi:hypothetical protein